MVDELPYGGTCALRGCDPKKMLVGVTEAADWVRRMAGRGLRIDRSEIDWSEMMAFKRTFTDVMPERMENGLQGLDLGIEVRLGACVTGVERGSDALAVRFDSPSGGGTLDAHLVVHGAGRVPDIDTLDIEAAGVEFGPGGVAVNRSMRSVSNAAVFAAGDAADTGAPALTPVSANEARVAFKNLLAGKDVRTVDHPPIPSIVFTLPAVACVGMLESEAAEEGLDVEVHHS